MAGGPSQIDTLDPKPGRPVENRGPFGVTKTKLPGVLVCEHLPKLAAALDTFTVIRSADPRGSNHEPKHGSCRPPTCWRNRATNPEARSYPRSRLCEQVSRSEPPTGARVCRVHAVPSHLAFGGLIGKSYDPFLANEAARLPVYDLVGKDTGQLSGGKMFELPADVSADRMGDRQQLLKNFDKLRADLDTSGTWPDWRSTSSRRSGC